MYRKRIAAFKTEIFTCLLPALLSGTILIGAFPPFGQGYLAWFALLPLIATCLRETPARSFLAGIIFGLPLNLYLNLYLSHVLFPHLPFLVALAAMICLVIYISLFSGVFALGASLAARAGKPMITALAVPSFWLLGEFLRSLGFMAYNVGYIGYSQWAYPWLLNLAAVYGYWGLPFMIVFFQVIVVLAWRKELQGKNLLVIVMFFLLLFSAGLLIPDDQPLNNTGRQIKVSLIQGNSNPQAIIESGKTEIMHNYIDLTKQAVQAQPSVELVVWPETVVDLNFRDGKKHLSAMIETTKELGINLLYGARIVDEGKLYNSITLIKVEDPEIIIYSKQRLVPFVEFFPFEELLNRMLKLELLLGSYTAGDEIVVFELNGTKLAGIICFESYFGDHARLFAAEDIDHLFILTNDAWFGESIGLDQHAQAAAIRAAETGVGVTQVANSGITISFDNKGRELFRSGKNEVSMITESIDLTRRSTIYVQIGDYFPAFWIIFLVVTLPGLFIRRTT